MLNSHESLEERFNWCCLTCERYAPIHTEEQKVIPNCFIHGTLYDNNTYKEDELREEKFKECDENNNYSLMIL